MTNTPYHDDFLKWVAVGDPEALEVANKAFDEAKHPRGAKGQPTGGKFVAKQGGAWARPQGGSAFSEEALCAFGHQGASEAADENLKVHGKNYGAAQYEAL